MINIFNDYWYRSLEARWTVGQTQRNWQFFQNPTRSRFSDGAKAIGLKKKKKSLTPYRRINNTVIDSRWQRDARFESDQELRLPGGAYRSSRLIDNNSGLLTSSFRLIRMWAALVQLPSCYYEATRVSPLSCCYCSLVLVLDSRCCSASSLPAPLAVSLHTHPWPFSFFAIRSR